MAAEQRVQPIRGQDPRRIDRGRSGPIYGPQERCEFCCN